MRVELLNPDHIMQPAEPRKLEEWLKASHKLNYWNHGVHTAYNSKLKRDDVSRPLGYHCVYDSVGDQWDYLPVNRVQHIKRNVGRTARRGVSDFVAIHERLRGHAKLERNTREGAAVQAAIAFIREHAEGVLSSGISAMPSNTATTDYQKPTKYGAQTTYATEYRPGSVIDTPFGRKYHAGPLGTLRSPVFLEVAQYELRVISVRWSFPEYMISGDASNSNLASHLVSEGPFVKARERSQRTFKHHFVELIWKALRLDHQAGRLGNAPWEHIRRLVSIKADAPEVASRDEQKQAIVDEALDRLKVKSKRAIAAGYGLDYDEEQNAIADEPVTALPQMSAMESTRLHESRDPRAAAAELLWGDYPSWQP